LEDDNMAASFHKLDRSATGATSDIGP